MLVVDDEREIAEMLAEILTGDGHRTEIAASGREALQRIALGSYDLIISDLRMPDMDGPSLYRALRAERPALANRMIFVTGDTLGATLSGFLSECGRPYIEKPFVPADVRRVIARGLAGGNGEAY